MYNIKLKLMYRTESPAAKAVSCRRIVVRYLKEYHGCEDSYPGLAESYRRNAIRFYNSMQFHRNNARILTIEHLLKREFDGLHYIDVCRRSEVTHVIPEVRHRYVYWIEIILKDRRRRVVSSYIGFDDAFERIRE